VTIAWQPNCANDVIYETIAVPEPATLLLLVSGWQVSPPSGAEK